MTSTRELVAAATDQLSAAGVDAARHDAEALLAHVLAVARSRLSGYGVVGPSSVDQYRAVVERRTRREPLQYIVGVAAFRYLEVAVGPGVFVPRPETEVMTGVAVAELQELHRRGRGPLRAVDLCTGSGAVAASLATEARDVQVTAVELAPAAHAYAVRNTVTLGVDARLGDMADAVDDLAGTVHVVTANPPYIPLSAFETVAAEARDFDPPESLWSGEDGLDAIRVVARVAARLLVDDGLLVCEHADVQGASARAVFASMPEWTRIRDNDDLAGRPRFVSARRVVRPQGTAGTMAP